MRSDLLLKLYEGDALIAGDGSSPGASARSHWAVSMHTEIGDNRGR